MIPCRVSLKGGTASTNVSLASVFFLEKFSLAGDASFFHIKNFSFDQGLLDPFCYIKGIKKCQIFWIFCTRLFSSL